MPRIDSGVDSLKLTSSVMKNEEVDTNWLSRMSTQAGKWFDAQAKNLGNWWEQVRGGAVEVGKAIARQDWQLFVDWFKEAPLIPKLAGTGAVLLTSAIVLLGGGAIVSAIGSGIGGVLSGLGVGGTLGAASVMPAVMTAAVQGVEWAWNVDWAESDNSIFKKCRQALESLYEPLGETLGRSAAVVIAGKFGSGVARVQINRRVCAAIWLLNPSLRERMLDALTDLVSAVKAVGRRLAFNLTFVGVRQIAAKLSGNEQWGEEGQDPFIISKKAETFYKQLKQSDVLKFISEKQWEGIEAGATAFWEELKDLLVEESTYVEWV